MHYSQFLDYFLPGIDESITFNQLLFQRQMLRHVCISDTQN